MKRRNFLKTGILAVGAFLFGKRLTANTQTQSSATLPGKPILVYCRIPHDKHCDKWQHVVNRYVRAENPSIYELGVNSSHDEVCSAATHLVGDDFYHPVTGVSFPMSNPHEFILRIQQDESAKSATYTRDSCGNEVPDIKVDRYLFSVYFKNEMREKGVDVLFVSEWGGVFEWYSPIHPCVDGDSNHKAVKANVFQYFQTPCPTAEESFNDPYFYTNNGKDTNLSPKVSNKKKLDYVS